MRNIRITAQRAKRYPARMTMPLGLSVSAPGDAQLAASGHDRCIIPIKPEHIDAWLNPDPANLGAQYAILDERERPHYEHRLAA